jgi:hypothetical protein
MLMCGLRTQRFCGTGIDLYNLSHACRQLSNGKKYTEDPFFNRSVIIVSALATRCSLGFAISKDVPASIPDNTPLIPPDDVPC